MYKYIYIYKTRRKLRNYTSQLREFRVLMICVYVSDDGKLSENRRTWHMWFTPLRNSHPLSIWKYNHYHGYGDRCTRCWGRKKAGVGPTGRNDCRTLLMRRRPLLRCYRSHRRRNLRLFTFCTIPKEHTGRPVTLHLHSHHATTAVIAATGTVDV